MKNERECEGGVVTMSGLSCKEDFFILNVLVKCYAPSM